jgi:Family of unknown function (DUF6481)
MALFKTPTFQDRVGQATQAKQKALAALREKPPVDERVVEERRAARARKEAAEAEKRAAKKAAIEAAKAEKIAAAEAAAAAAAAIPAPPTEAERKAARDARYAARKKRK